MAARFRNFMSGTILVAMIAIAAAGVFACGGDGTAENDVQTGLDTNGAADTNSQDDTVVDAVSAATSFQCTVCDYIYNPAVGDPAQGIPAGTSFYDLPETWKCPDCGAAKSAFEVLN